MWQSDINMLEIEIAYPDFMEDIYKYFLEFVCMHKGSLWHFFEKKNVMITRLSTFTFLI
mgnify:CR=1 FL=1